MREDYLIWHHDEAKHLPQEHDTYRFHGTKDEAKEAADALYKHPYDALSFQSVKEYLAGLPELPRVPNLFEKVVGIFKKAGAVKTPRQALAFHLNVDAKELDKSNWRAGADNICFDPRSGTLYCAVKEGEATPVGYDWVRDPDTPLGLDGWQIYKRDGKEYLPA